MRLCSYKNSTKQRKCVQESSIKQPDDVDTYKLLSGSGLGQSNKNTRCRRK